MGIFKAYDIRGLYPEEIDARTARLIGRAVAEVLEARTCAVGRDCRLSGEELERAAIEGLLEAGCGVHEIGPCTTPMNYFAGGHLETDAALMITASHNPGHYNGFKVSGQGARPISYETGLGTIEKRVGELAAAGPAGRPPKKSGGSVESIDLFEEYRARLLALVPETEVGPLTLAVDAANGMGGPMVSRLLPSWPRVRLHGLYLEPDGRFPNHEPNPLKKENMADLVRLLGEKKADLGAAYDGDGDRVMFVDEEGTIVRSDLVTALLAREFLAREPGAAVIYDPRSSRVVPETIRAAGGRPVECRVGHSYMKGALRESGGPVGGELSGHYYFRDLYCSDSADLALLKIMALMTRERKSLAEILRPLRKYHATGEINFEVADKDAMIERLARKFADGEQSRLDGITVRFPEWWFNARKSNTEPLLRLNIEAETPERLAELRAMMEKILRQG